MNIWQGENLDCTFTKVYETAVSDNKLTVSASLAGICVTREANGTVYATLGEIRAEMTERTAAGLLSPASALFSDAALLSVQKTEVSGQKMTLLTLEDGIAITLSASGIPTKLQTDAFYMEIVWWECKNFAAEE